jgi:hypothetical protein
MLSFSEFETFYRNIHIQRAQRGILVKSILLNEMNPQETQLSTKKAYNEQPTCHVHLWSLQILLISHLITSEKLQFSEATYTPWLVTRYVFKASHGN